MSRMRMTSERFYGIAAGNIHRNDAGFLIGHGFGQPTVSTSYVQDRAGVLRNRPDDHLIQSPALLLIRFSRHGCEIIKHFCIALVMIQVVEIGMMPLMNISGV